MLAFGRGLALLKSRSVVPGVEPQGIGTPLVEHAPSVIVRTAWRNGLTPARMLRDVAAAVVDSDGFAAGDRDAAIARLEFALRRRGVGLLGADRVASTWVDWYERLTRRPGLSHHTLLPLTRVLGSRGLLRWERAYCPAHLRQWRRDDQPIYEPLVWQLRPVVVCPYHEDAIRLETRCPNETCRARRSVLTASAVPGVCERCGMGLWTAEPVPWRGEDLTWRRWVAVELGGVVADLGAAEVPPSGQVIPLLVALAVERSGMTLTAFAASMGVALSTVSLWKDGRRQPSIDGVLRLCRVAGFRVADFLFGRSDALEATLRPDEIPGTPASTTVYHDIDWRAFRRALHRALVDPSCPSPMTVAKRWNVNDRQARRTCPELWTQLSTRSRDRMRREARARAAERARLITDAIRAIHEEGRYPSRHQVAKRIPLRVSFRDPLLVDVWTRELTRLGYRRSEVVRAA